MIQTFLALGIYPRERKAYVQTEASILMFREEGIFVITNNETSLMSTHKWISKLCYFHIMEYVAVKGNELLIHATLPDLSMLRVRSQKMSMYSLIEFM